MLSEGKTHEALTTFIHEVEITHKLHSDGAKVLVLGEFHKKTKKYEIKTSGTEPNSSWQNNTK